MGDNNLRTLKYVNLITLTGQNALLGLSMRYGRTRSGDMFFESTAVLMAEVVKMITCLWLVFNGEAGRNLGAWKRSLWDTIVINWADTLKACIPSLIYLLQNTLLYTAAENLDVATYQITYQLKIFTTAIFAYFILNKVLLKTQWMSLCLLLAGVAAVQLSDAKETSSVSGEQNRVKGFMAATTATVLSGFAGIYFEKILKGSDVSVWMRNVQLSMLSIPLGIFTAFVRHGEDIASKGFFFGYDLYVIYLVVLNATGGLLVAVVVKYADNILKGFACSLAIIISSTASVFLFGFQMSFMFVVGAALVISSIFLYGYVPPKSSSIP
uniref:UDP-galactose translocator n=1 Tax=Caligus rogercresseyi TaxID=217165 RepID=C1BQR1_CALRO|nr:UDP-galactose translocator [Caligus rogercresseyi]